MQRFFEIAATMEDVISLGVGAPDFVTPEIVLEAGVASLRRGETKYTAIPGTRELRRAIARHLERRYGVAYDPEGEILVTAGTSQGLQLAATTVLDAGDEVIVPQPCFLSYLPVVQLAGGVPVPLRTAAAAEFQVSPDDVAAAVTRRTKALLLNSPNNPTGAVLRRETLESIAEVVREHDLLVISDEIYDRLVYGVEHVCVATVEGLRERTILLGGFSKSYAMPGWRLGYVAAPRELVAAMTKVFQYTMMCSPTTAQVAAVTALERAEEAVEAMRREFERRRRLIVDGLNGLGLPCCEPRGAFYAFPSIAATGLTDGEFCERLLREERVATIPGSCFGRGGEGHIRCSYAAAYEQIEAALGRIAQLLWRL
jgi:aminotransferase